MVVRGIVAGWIAARCRRRALVLVIVRMRVVMVVRWVVARSAAVARLCLILVLVLVRVAVVVVVRGIFARHASIAICLVDCRDDSSVLVQHPPRGRPFSASAAEERGAGRRTFEDCGS